MTPKLSGRRGRGRALLFSSGAFASDRPTVVVLGDGGRLVGPLAVYGPNGEKLLELRAGEKLPADERPFWDCCDSSGNPYQRR